MKKKSNGQYLESSRRGEILVAAAALFRAKGYEASTIRDITTAVGIGSGSTFCHFRSKREILDAVAIEGMRHVLAGAEAVANQDLTPENCLKALIRQHIGFLHDPLSRDFVTVLLYEARALSAGAKKEVMRLMALYEDIWKACLQGLVPVANGRLRGAVSDSLLHRLLFGALNWSVHWYSPDDELPPEVLAEALAELVLPAMRGSAESELIGRSAT
ncbi:MAG: TetR/AcrR family transcriptional regulator [Dechloromonas sp.]|uniref:TetR/AcrR family transcriptional regulator n=1 Tax=Azonexus hydrophilus TaxID=418702 RepID=UPI0003F7E020|nr:TetR/AcrR family transcriptional regulator [Azonexus hydrophilus]MCA1937720.1 TetR/AcrR family transcriptional regulator [Dechloromonas sp.]